MSADPRSSELVAGRSCAECTMCCKLLSVESLGKPRAVWCQHCDQKRGCRIYENRPAECGAFYCGWRRIKHLDDRWKPAKSKLIVNYEPETARIVIHVDPVRPDAWRSEPYYATIKAWSQSAARRGTMVIVRIGERATVIYPDRDEEHGVVRDDQVFVPVKRMTRRGLATEFELVDAGDPRAKG